MVARIVLAVILLSAAMAAILSVRLIRAATALAIGNTALAIYLLTLDARHAGMIQLSVGVGVLSALFLVAISLTETMRGGSHER